MAVTTGETKSTNKTQDKRLAFNLMSDVLDSTTTALAAGATYSGSTEDARGYKQIIGSVFADQDGTLKVQQSQDGTNWDVQESIAYTANNLTGFTVEVVAPNVRIVYDNGATGQTTFRLYMRGRVV